MLQITCILLEPSYCYQDLIHNDCQISIKDRLDLMEAQSDHDKDGWGCWSICESTAVRGAKRRCYSSNHASPSYYSFLLHPPESLKKNLWNSETKLHPKRLTNTMYFQVCRVKTPNLEVLLFFTTLFGVKRNKKPIAIVNVASMKVLAFKRYDITIYIYRCKRLWWIR